MIDTLLRECYRPKFRYRKEALSASEAWDLFTKSFHFLPEITSEPDRLADMIQRLIWQQSDEHNPLCVKHEITMVMLGRTGWVSMRPLQKSAMTYVHRVGKNGRVVVARGLFRCPTPNCYFVAPIRNSDYYPPS